jgi:hypothetical protein
MHHPADPLGHWLFGIVFSGGGISALIGLLFSVRKNKSIQQWPSVTGTITESTTVGSFQNCGRGRTWIEEPKVSYTYTVEGQEFTGHTIAIAEMDTASKQAALDKIAPYPVGQEVPVFYNPKSPDDAVLEKKASSGAFVMLGIIGAIFLTIGILIITQVIGI